MQWDGNPSNDGDLTRGGVTWGFRDIKQGLIFQMIHPELVFCKTLIK